MKIRNVGSRRHGLPRGDPSYYFIYFTGEKDGAMLE